MGDRHDSLDMRAVRGSDLSCPFFGLWCDYGACSKLPNFTIRIVNSLSTVATKYLRGTAVYRHRVKRDLDASRQLVEVMLFF